MILQTAYNVVAYKDKPRLKSAVEMLKTTEEIEQRLKEVYFDLLAYLNQVVGVGENFGKSYRFKKVISLCGKDASMYFI